MKRVSREVWRVSTTVGFVAAGALVLWLLRQDRSSIERGNGLYRSGDPASAEQVYEIRSHKGESSPVLSYNLGTAFLQTNPDSAEGRLRSAAESLDSAVVQRGSYNLAYYLLTKAAEAVEPEAARSLLGEAVDGNRTALRLDPTDEAARWNLAVSQRMLDSILAESGKANDREVGRDVSGLQVEGGIVDEARRSVADARELGDADETSRQGSAVGDTGTRGSVPSASESSPPADDVAGRAIGNGRQNGESGQRMAARQGSREALAGRDEGPLSAEAARGMIRAVTDDAEALIKGILWSHRPDIAWWDGKPFPGGDW